MSFHALEEAKLFKVTHSNAGIKSRKLIQVIIAQLKVKNANICLLAISIGTFRNGHNTRLDDVPQKNLC